MGVWHVCGMGLNPGAVTSPLTYVYLMLKAAMQSNDEAMRLFEFSGEKSQAMKGAPEALVILTSKDVMSGTQGPVKDEWFQTIQQKSAPITLARYLSNLLTKLRDDDFSEFYAGSWIRYVYFLEVNHQDFEDCFYKSYVTLKGLQDKEIWINMIGGTNQINSALLIASTFQGVSARYYYIFQNDIRLLHPQIEKPDFDKPLVQQLLANWYELPVFHLGMGEIMRGLNQLFEHREEVNVSEIERLIEGLGLRREFLAKLRGRLVKTEHGTASRGFLLERWNNIYGRAEEGAMGVDNFSQWIKWARNQDILWELTLDGTCEKSKHK